MKITFLGTGTSCGVPMIGCHCRVCTSTDPRDSRLRTSALFEEGGKRILLDCGPDFREQMLRIGMEGMLDAVFITHEHYDHVGGIDDLRPFSYLRSLTLYADAYSCRHLRERLPYCLVDHHYPGIPRLELQEIAGGDRVMVGQVPVTALQVMHGRLPILGYRIGDVAYLTDVTEVPEETLPLLDGVSMLIVNGLKHSFHPTHQTVEDAISFSRSLGRDIPTYIIHMSHEVGLHAEEDAKLPPDVHLAYDGLTVECSMKKTWGHP